MNQFEPVGKRRACLGETQVNWRERRSSEISRDGRATWRWSQTASNWNRVVVFSISGISPDLVQLFP